MRRSSILFVSALASLTLLLSACSGLKLPETGIPSIYDGKWSGNLDSPQTECKNITVDFEVRFSHAVGTVYERGHDLADLWGIIEPDGKLNALIGQLGISGAQGDIQFTKDNATGTWSSKACKGTADLKRI